MDLFEEWINKDDELIEYALTDKSYKSVYSKEHRKNLPKNKTNFELATYGDAILKMCKMEILYDKMYVNILSLESQVQKCVF